MSDSVASNLQEHDGTATQTCCREQMVMADQGAGAMVAVRPRA